MPEVYGPVKADVSPVERLSHIGQTAVEFGIRWLYQLGTTLPIATINKESDVISRVTTMAGYAGGLANLRYYYYEVDDDGMSYFLGGSDKKMEGAKDVLINQSSFQRPGMSDIANTTQAVADLTTGLYGNPEYDPLFNEWRNSMPAEQARLYELHGMKQTLGEIEHNGRKHRIVRVDRFNPFNMAVSMVYWTYRELGIKLTRPIADTIADRLKGTGVDTNQFIEDYVSLMSDFDKGFTGIGFYPRGAHPLESPTYNRLKSLARSEHESNLALRAVVDPASVAADRNVVSAQKQMILDSMGAQAEELL